MVQPIQPVRIPQIIQGGAEWFALLAGAQLNLFTPLANGPLTADELAAAGNLTAEQSYNLACSYALAAAKLPPADAGRAAGRAVALLRQALAQGFRDFAHLAKDSDLTALRGRADFAELLWDLADAAKD